MSHYELKTVGGNQYWYRRTLVDGRQKSEYIGKKLPPEVQISQQKYEADRRLEADRRDIERKIAELSRQLAQLKSG